jgi:sodium-dependent dicarboxylate transporter 2/3/5
VASERSLWKRWWAIALGPLAFVLVELIFRPGLVVPEELIERYPVASPIMVRHALAATAWIACWWFTEALPIPATSLLPIALFPCLGLAGAREVAREYGHEIIFLFLGGFLLALAMERTGLHQRVALRVIGGIGRVLGTGMRPVVLGFMVATAVMSMWISNTATTVMLLPVALAILSSAASDEDAVDAPFAVALLLGIAFAANIGGLGTPVGSPPNIIFQEVYHRKTGEEVSFARWMTFGVPVILVLLPGCWWLLVRRLPRRTAVELRLPELGPTSRAERWVMAVFTLTVLAWITRGDVQLGNELHLRGWGGRLADAGLELRDSTVAVIAALTLFMVPMRRGEDTRILDWSVAPRLPWGVLLLMGAGFAISRAFDRSGLTLWVGGQLEGLGALALPDGVLYLVLVTGVVIVSIVVTEFASNTASANILLPCVFGVCAALGVERFPPEPLMVACALACTTGFAVPAGTPPNALVFATERISIGRFVRIGLLVDALALVVLVAMLGWRSG